MLCADTVIPAAGKTCFQIPEYSLSVAKIVQGESSEK
ncbi:unknown [Prevotella sp. CAG:487]|nr:unknown [Prevotella sp. CAG:487]